MKRLLLVAAATIMTDAMTAAHAGGCVEETIRSVARGGSVVVLESGGIYKVEPDDISDTALWNAGDGVLVCGDGKLINKDNGDTVYVTPAPAR
jgi:hypothetical protein